VSVNDGRRVPVVTDIQFVKYVEVEAETEQAAVAEVERCITLSENDEESTNPTVAGLTSEAVNEAVTEFQSFGDGELMDWQPAIVMSVDRILVDRWNSVQEVKAQAAH
jgi:hypothetical protein